MAVTTALSRLPRLATLSIPNNNTVSEDWDSLLYDTYDDYFDMKEEASLHRSGVLSKFDAHGYAAQTGSSSVTSSSDSSHASGSFDSPLQPPESKNLGSSTGSTSFFFVVSGPSPTTPRSATGFTPISPLRPGDIPEALSNLLPQPSNSLSQVIKLAKSQYALEEAQKEGKEDNLERVNGAFSMEEHERVKRYEENPLSQVPKNRFTTSVMPSLRNSHSPSQPQLGDSYAATSISHTMIINPPISDVPASATVEIPSSLPSFRKRPLPNPFKNHDPQMRTTYHHPGPSILPSDSVSSSSSAATQSLTGVDWTLQSKSRVREPRSLNVVSTRPKENRSGRGPGHVRGVSSPFPLPITLNFAPDSLPGSTRTPYGYL